jgi:hypothetical protein
MNRKRVILAALLGTLVLCLLYAYFATPRLEKAPPRVTSSRSVKDVEAPGERQVNRGSERINFDYMTTEPQEFSGAQRDIFRFVQRPPVRTEPPVAIAPPPVAEAVQPIQPVMPIAVVQQALSQFTFLGFLDKEGEKTVFLSSGGKLFLVTNGESFGAKNEFQVKEIKENLLKVQHAGRADIVEIPLIEKQKLNVSVSAPARLAPMSSGAGASRAQNLTSKRRMLRPAVPQQSEQPFPPDVNEETNPTEEQVSEPPAEGDVLEGEVNGTNQ